jgi:2-polyprenyl-3-methyl-5-hydroxy-6-metoxy-1,4-benzoquinol methylase
MKAQQPDACPICHGKQVTEWSASKDVEYFTSEEVYNYYHCANCITIFIHPVPVEQLSLIYPPNYYSFLPIKKTLAGSVKEMLDKRLFRKLLRQLPGNELNVLDVGGGTGWLLNLIRSVDSRVKKTQVVDMDTAAQAKAQQDGHDYFLGKIEDFGTDTKFDLVLMLNLIEHVANPREVLLKAQSMLKPGGLILIKTPNIESRDARKYQRTYWGGLHCPRHWVLFSGNSFRHMLQGTELDVHTLQYTQGAPFWAWSVIIQGVKKGRLIANKERPVMNHPLYPWLTLWYAGYDFARGIFAKTSQMFIVLRRR